MGPMAKTLISQEFGQIPREILVAPYYLSGCMFHVPGVQPQRLDYETPIAWRKDLDYWMNRKAEDKGVEMWDGAKVISVVESDGKCVVVVEKGGEQQELKARFVVGADGAYSAVRRSLFPELEVQYTRGYRECYEGELNLDKDYWHWFFPCGLRPKFDVIYKGDFFLLEGDVKELKDEIRRILADYGFDPKKKPLWQDGCLSRALVDKELFSGSFSPAKGNVLLAGDAVGLKIFVSGEGIGTALKSGLLAATSIVRAIEVGEKAAGIYLRELEPVIATLRPQYFSIEKIKEQAIKGPELLLCALREAFEESLTVV